MFELLLFFSFLVYVSAVVVILKSSHKETATKPKKSETVTSKQTCPSCKKSYEKPKYEFEEVYNDEEETLIKSIAECPKCDAEISSRLFSSTRGEIQ